MAVDEPAGGGRGGGGRARKEAARRAAQGSGADGDAAGSPAQGRGSGGAAWHGQGGGAGSRAGGGRGGRRNFRDRLGAAAGSGAESGGGRGGGGSGAGAGGVGGGRGGTDGGPWAGRTGRDIGTDTPSHQEAAPDEGAADPLADAREQFRHVSLFWTDLIHLMASKPQALTSAGPMRNYAENAKAIATEMLAAGQDAAEFSEALSKYYDQLAATWASAQRKVDAKLPRIPNDLERFEAYKRVWIDMFDNDFTELFDSKRFGDNYGRLVSKELDLARHWNNVMNVVLRSANLPNKKDIDGVYRELHGLKRRISKLEAENRRLRAAAEAGGSGGGGAAGAAEGPAAGAEEGEEKAPGGGGGDAE